MPVGFEVLEEGAEYGELQRDGGSLPAFGHQVVAPPEDIFCGDEGFVLIADEGEEFADHSMVKPSSFSRD